MATIRKRTWLSSGEQKVSWQCTYRDQGGKRPAKQFPSKKAATDFLATAAYEVRAGIHTPASTKLTVGDCLDQWLAHCEASSRVSPLSALFDAT